MYVFNRFIVPIPQLDGRIDLENGPFDASQITSRKCFEMWLKSRIVPPKNPEHSFQRTISAHVTGLDGRRPFSKPMEAAVLRVIRQRGKWPCFENGPMRHGFRAQGYHEKAAAAEAKRLLQQVDSMQTTMLPPSPPPPPAQHVLFTSSSSNAGEEVRFIQAASNLLRNNNVGNFSTWERVFSLGKLSLKAKGWNSTTFPTSISMSDVEAILAQYETYYPYSAVVLVDLMATNSRDVICATSLAAQLFLGPVTRTAHGFDPSMIRNDEDRWQLFLAIVQASQHAGREMPTQVVVSKGAYLAKFELRVCMFARERILAIRGWPM